MSTNLLQLNTKKLGVAILFAVAGAFTSAQSAELAKPAAEVSQSTSAAMTEEERQQWIENRLSTFEDFVTKSLQAREQLATGMDDIVSKKQDNRKSACKTTDILLVDYFNTVAKVNQMITELEKYLDRLNESQRSRLLAVKAKMPELMSKIRGCESY